MYLSQVVLLIISPMLLLILLGSVALVMTNTIPVSHSTGTEVKAETRVMLLCVTSSNVDKLMQTECVIVPR